MRPCRINLVQPAPNLAGGTKSGRLLMEALVRSGHEVRLVFPTVPSLPRSWRPSRWSDWNRRWALARSGNHHMASTTAHLVPARGTVVRARHVPDADVTIANFWMCREWMQGWPARTGVPALFIRGHFLDFHKDRIEATYRMPGVNFVHALFLKKLLEQDYDDPHAILIHNGMDPRFDSPPRGKHAEPTVGYMFQVGPRKGSDTARAAIDRIRRTIPGLRVIAFGSTPPTSNWPLAEGTEFHLQPAQERIPALYERCDVWLLPSRVEGFPMPGLEAFGCHTPVVSTLCGGPDEYIVEGVSGYLVPVEDHTAMADRAIEVLQLRDDLWRQMSHAGYTRSREFSWEYSGQRMEHALRSILTGEHPIRG